MLRQASIHELRSGRIRRGYVVVTMRRYPRYLRREQRDEYLRSMAPDEALFSDWLASKRRHRDHEGAFRRVHYESRFGLSAEGWAELRRLARLARRRNVYLVCQCQRGERCHRELLLLLARELLHAPAEKPVHAYPIFQRRMRALKARASRDSRAPRRA